MRNTNRHDTGDCMPQRVISSKSQKAASAYIMNSLLLENVFLKMQNAFRVDDKFIASLSGSRKAGSKFMSSSIVHSIS